jgi:hypothetical protein
MNFKDWQHDLERRASEVKETLSPGRVKDDLQRLVDQLVGQMDEIERIVTMLSAEKQFSLAYSTIDTMIACFNNIIEQYTPSSPKFDVTTTTFPQHVIDLFSEWHKITVEHLQEMRRDVTEFELANGGAL